MKCINASQTTSRQWKESPTLFFKFTGTPVAVKEQIGLVQKIVSKTAGRSFEFARGEEEMQELWSARKEALWSVMAMKRSPDDHVWTTHVAVPMSKLPDIIEATKEDMTQSRLLAGICGHVGDGNFHGGLILRIPSSPHPANSH
jgi:D-lactate dehydrogenase (cytochrome)